LGARPSVHKRVTWVRRGTRITGQVARRAPSSSGVTANLVLAPGIALSADPPAVGSCEIEVGIQGPRDRARMAMSSLLSIEPEARAGDPAPLGAGVLAASVAVSVPRRTVSNAEIGARLGVE